MTRTRASSHLKGPPGSHHSNWPDDVEEADKRKEDVEEGECPTLRHR